MTAFTKDDSTGSIYGALNWGNMAGNRGTLVHWASSNLKEMGCQLPRVSNLDALSPLETFVERLHREWQGVTNVSSTVIGNS